MDSETRDALRKMLERLWEFTASKSKRTAILIDRDKLEYKKNNYYGKNGEISRIEEVRPYMRGDLYDLHNIEMNLIENEVPVSSLFFVDIPTIAEIDRRVEEKKKEKDNQIK